MYLQDIDLKYMYLLLVLAQHTQTHNVPCAKYWFGRIKGYEWEWAADLYCIPWLMGAECTCLYTCIVLYTWVDGGSVHRFLEIWTFIPHSLFNSN